MKELYSFSVSAGGKDAKFMIGKPSRRQMDEAETQYAIEISNCIRRGILTKAMLAKKYADTGGMLTEGEAKRLSELYEKFTHQTAEFTRLSVIEAKTKKTTDKIRALEEEMSHIKKEIVDIEMTNLSLFQNTADTKAQIRVITWYVLYLTFIENNGEWEPYFKGKSFEERLDFYYEKEDSDDEFYRAAIKKIMAIISFWFYSSNTDQKGFDKMMEDYLKQDEGEQPTPEKPSVDEGEVKEDAK